MKIFTERMNKSCDVAAALFFRKSILQVYLSVKEMPVVRLLGVSNYSFSYFLCVTRSRPLSYDDVIFSKLGNY